MLDSSFSIVLAFEDIFSYPNVLMCFFFFKLQNDDVERADNEWLCKDHVEHADNEWLCKDHVERADNEWLCKDHVERADNEWLCKAYILSFMHISGGLFVSQY